MIETEILVEVFDPFENVKECLCQFEYCGLKETIDTYYYDPMRQTLKPYPDGKLYASFRTRQKGKQFFVTYKRDHYDRGIWQYSDEYETSVECLKQVELIIENLGLKQLLRLDSKKYIYKSGDYEIVLESVRNLGTFLEVELKKEIKANEVAHNKEKIMQFISGLGISCSDELNSGKPELFLQRNGISMA